MKSFLVKTLIKQLDAAGNASYFKEGDTIELNDKDAEELKGIAAIEDFTAAAPTNPQTPSVSLAPEGAAKIDAIKTAITQISADDKTLWTDSGQPTIAAIIAITKWDVSEAERDQAFPVPVITPDAPEGAAKIDAIKAAIATLNKEDATLWTKGKQPTTAAIVAITKWDVSSAERDQAFPKPAA